MEIQQAFVNEVVNHIANVGGEEIKVSKQVTVRGCDNPAVAISFYKPSGLHCSVGVFGTDKSSERAISYIDMKCAY
jgi:hypothetical protein